MYKSRERRSASGRARSFPPFPPPLFLQTFVTKQSLSFSLSLVGRFMCLYKLKTSIQIARGAHSHTQTHHLTPLATNKNYRVWTLKHVNYHLRVDETTHRNKRDDHKEKGQFLNNRSVSPNYSRLCE